MCDVSGVQSSKHYCHQDDYHNREVLRQASHSEITKNKQALIRSPNENQDSWYRHWCDLGLLKGH